MALRTGPQGSGGGGGGNDPYGVNLGTMDSSAQYVEHVGSVMVGEVNRLMSALENLGAAQWGGDADGAAAAFRTAKGQWQAAHQHLQKALDDIAAGLKTTSTKFNQAEQDSTLGIKQAVQGLTYS